MAGARSGDTQTDAFEVVGHEDGETASQRTKGTVEITEAEEEAEDAKINIHTLNIYEVDEDDEEAVVSATGRVNVPGGPSREFETSQQTVPFEYESDSAASASVSPTILSQVEGKCKKKERTILFLDFRGLELEILGLTIRISDIQVAICCEEGQGILGDLLCGLLF